MPRIDIDLAPFRAARENLAGLAAERRRLDHDITQAEQALHRAERSGGADTPTLQRRVQEAKRARQSLIERAAGARRAFDDLAERIRARRDPSQLVQSLDGDRPIALLPLRLETRYLDRGGERVLGVRVYPDDLHTIEHEPTPTAPELATAQAIWRARFAHDEPEAERLLRDLITAQGRGRARWLVRTLTPANPMPPAGQVTEPEFPSTETVDARARTTRAVLLPERFCAIGYATGRREVFRAWGNTVPDELVLTPDWQATDQPEKLLAGERAWMIDFEAALANGMALVVRQSDVTGRFDLARGTLERLVVVGFEWTKAPDDAADDLASLLAAHRDATGLGFVPLGTPTNNTEAVRAGAEPPAPAPGTDALDLLHWAFGLAPGALPPGDIANAHLAEQRTALHMLNVLWRGTFGDQLLQMWNPRDDDGDPLLTPGAIYDLRHYAASYVRPTGALPVLRVRQQPIGLLPIVGRRYARDGESKAETAVDKVTAVLRPMWELAVAKVPRLLAGDLKDAQELLQSAPWSQTAQYRDKDVNVCLKPSPISGAFAGARDLVVRSVLKALGPWEVSQVHAGVCNDFLPDPPYAAGTLAGVPWVKADAQQPAKEAPAGTLLTAGENYLARLAAAAVQHPSLAEKTLTDAQDGPSLLQALAAYSVQKEQGDAADDLLADTLTVRAVISTAMTAMPHVEALPKNETFFTIHTHRELMGLQVRGLTGPDTLGAHVAHVTATQLPVLASANGSAVARELFDKVDAMLRPTRNLGIVKLGLDWLAGRTVGELNVAFRSTLDVFSYRLDAWLLARANRRLDEMRKRQPRGLHIGAYAFVEDLSSDTRPDSDGYLLCPSQAQAAGAALLRSGFLSNADSGAFDIALDSRRTQRAEGLLEGLARDQPLAALYGYRIERALRDTGLGRLIWPLRLVWPWHAGSAAASGEAQESVGARDVVDGSALLEAWDEGSGAVAVFKALDDKLKSLTSAGAILSDGDKTRLSDALADAADLADSVADLLMAEGAYQIAQGNPARAAAAMAVADKQALPVETEVGRTPRGGASYTQRVVAICPEGASAWPQDRRAAAEPALDRWLAARLGDPARYVFTARIHRRDVAGNLVIDAGEPTVGAATLARSALSLVLMTSGEASPHATPVAGAAPADTGLRGAIAAAFYDALGDVANVTAIEVLPETAGALGFAPFEAFCTTLKALVDKLRAANRHDLVVPEDVLEQADAPGQGAYPGVDVAEIVGRADAAVAAFTAARDALLASADADALLAALDGIADDLLAPAAWPAQVHAIDAPGADPAQREARATAAKAALKLQLDAIADEASAPPPLLDGQAAPTPQQLAQHAVKRIQRIHGKDFPVLPRFTLGAYAPEFGMTLAAQATLTTGDAWRVHGWLAQAARVREGVDRLAAALSAHEALVAPLGASDLPVLQFPLANDSVWAALPEAWREADDAPFDPKATPEELHAWLQQPGAPRQRNIHRVAPKLALVLHAPGLAAPDAQSPLAAFVCDDWPEFVPDPYQTAAIAFHHDAPGARPPQSVLLALPPQARQDAWTFDDVLDCVHEAFDLARLRAVRPRDLGSGLGALLPANHLPADYTDELPSVRLLELRRKAMKQAISQSADTQFTAVLGKV